MLYICYTLNITKMSKTEKIVIRVTPQDKALITEKANKDGLSVSSYVLSNIKKLISNV